MDALQRDYGQRDESRGVAVRYQNRAAVRVALAVCCTLVLTSCGDDGPPGSTAEPIATVQVANVQTTTIPAPLDREAAVASAIDVRASGCGPRVRLGTGTAIPDGLILTAAHVLAGAEFVEVIDSTGTAAEASVVLFDPDLDVAVLRANSASGTAVQLRAEPAREDETGIVVLTRLTADTMEVEIIDVRVLRPVNILTTDIYLEQDVEREGFEVTAPIEPGDSGAMVHLPGGGVGIIWARSNENEGRAWAVNTPDILLDPDERMELHEPVDVGPCPD